LDAVARIGHASTVPLLASQLMSKNAAMKMIAIEGLARLGDAARLTEIQSALGGERNDNVLLAGQFASAALSSASIDPIVESLVKPRLRDEALQYIIELAAGRSSLFTRHVQDPDARIRADVIDALGLAYDPAALPLVEAATRDADPQVARAAARALARLRAIS
jgi:HEAT repeat protein